MMRCAILFDNLGPYHFARLAAAANVVDLNAIQGGTRSTTYAWNSNAKPNFPVFSVNPRGPSEALTRTDFTCRLNELLTDVSPKVVFVPGWANRLALLAMQWSTRRRIPIVIMSESTPWDEPRIKWKEAIKRVILRNASAALVGGSAHYDYCLQLGMEPSSVFDGYDTVDNEYFAQRAKAIRSADSHDNFACPDFFLASCRFIEKKNLFRLLDAHASHCRRNENPWDLCLLGDGPLRDKLIDHCNSLGLNIRFTAPWELNLAERENAPSSGRVFMPGFRQIDELPLFYARANFFVHASTTEQWGLVVNEAMASGLPVIVSDRCGCALDLVLDGETGWKFDPRNTDELTGRLDLMRTLSRADFDCMAANTISHISNWGPDRFANSVSLAAEYAAINLNGRISQKASLLSSLLLRVIGNLST